MQSDEDIDGRALSHLLILDLSQDAAGGYCTKLLADMGAQVIKVEPPGGTDGMRHPGPVPDDPEKSSLFLYLNMGKKGITLDFKAPKGQELLRGLVQSADVLVESFQPGIMTKLGLDYLSLEQVNPSLVMTSITYFGQEGPFRDYIGSELVADAASGYMYLTGESDREPLKPVGRQAEYQGGVNGALASLVAITARAVTGRGQHADVAIVDSLISTYDGASIFNLLIQNGSVAKRVGTRLIGDDPHRLYPSRLLPCKDGYVHVHYSLSIPEAMAVLTGNPRLADAELLATPRGHADEIDRHLMDWLKHHTRDEAMWQAQELRLPWTKVQSIDEVVSDPQSVATEQFVEVQHPEAGPARYPRPALDLSESPWEPKRAPLVGEHTREVLAQLLGLSDRDIAQLQEQGVV